MRKQFIAGAALGAVLMAVAVLIGTTRWPVLADWCEVLPDRGLQEAQVAALQGDVEALRCETILLREAVDAYLGGIVPDYQAEVERLHDELRRLYNLRLRNAPRTEASAGPSPADPPMYAAPQPPVPNIEAIRQQDERALIEAFEPDSARFTVVREWGRSPEEAGQLGSDTPSLKGLVCVVRKGMTANELLALGRELRRIYKAYDNINIELFDDADAARVFVDENIDPFGRRVMSISRHARSGRDVLLLINGEGITEYPGLE